MSFDALLLQNGILEHGAEALSPSGERTVTWSLTANVKCMVYPVPAPEAVKVGVLEQFTHVVFIRYRADMVAAPKDLWRVRVGAAEYRVVVPYDPAARKHHLELRCRKLE